MIAQENVDVKKETITKKARVGDKYSEDIQVMEEVLEQTQVIGVDKNNKINIIVGKSKFDADKLKEEIFKNKKLNVEIKAKYEKELNASKQ